MEKTAPAYRKPTRGAIGNHGVERRVPVLMLQLADDAAVRARGRSAAWVARRTSRRKSRRRDPAASPRRRTQPAATAPRRAPRAKPASRCAYRARECRNGCARSACRRVAIEAQLARAFDDRQRDDLVRREQVFGNRTRVEFAVARRVHRKTFETQHQARRRETPRDRIGVITLFAGRQSAPRVAIATPQRSARRWGHRKKSPGNAAVRFALNRIGSRRRPQVKS